LRDDNSFLPFDRCFFTEELFAGVKS